MMEHSKRVTVFGSTGFIGRAVLVELLQAGAHCTAVSRTLQPQPSPRVTAAAADLLDPGSLDAALAGAEVVVHAASYTGSDPGQCWEINERGTMHLCEAAARGGIEQILYVSTVGVYGPGPHRGIVEGQLLPNPATELSASRLAAEHAVRAHGGLVLRAGFVHGAGDRWLLSGLARILSALGAWVDDGQSLLSTIAVESLGQLIAAMAIRDLPVELRGGVLHAGGLKPSTVRSLAELASAQFGMAIPAESLSVSAALDRAPSVGLTPRQIDLVGRDHFYDSGMIWGYAGGR